MQLRQTGLMPYFEGRIFSGYETPRSKPFPDVYLAAAAALRASPHRCAVVEDTVTGVTAGVAAGAYVYAYAPLGNGADLRAAGASWVFQDMADLPARRSDRSPQETHWPQPGRRGSLSRRRIHVEIEAAAGRKINRIVIQPG